MFLLAETSRTFSEEPKKKKKTKTLGISRAKYAQERAFYSFFWPRIGEENEKKKKRTRKRRKTVISKVKKKKAAARQTE